MYISVLIPNFNNEKYLDQCLKSAIDQTIEKNLYEIIVFDDFSTDSSRDTIKKYNGIKFRFSDKNVGLSKAREELLKLSSKKSTHIFFLDSDDWIDTNCLKELLKTTQENDNKIAACGTLRNGKLKSTSKGGKLSIINTTQHSKLWPKENLKNIKWPKRLKNEDDYVIPWALNGKELIVNKKAIYHHRIVDGSLSTIKNKKNAMRMVDLALKNWTINEQNLSILHHSVSPEGAGKYYKTTCKKKNIKRPNFFQKIKWIGFLRTFADFWTDLLFR